MSNLSTEPVADFPSELELVNGERVLEQRDHAGGSVLVSDGNSRWVVVDDTAYFVVNAKYQAPEE
jgi:hypothetical protein